METDPAVVPTPVEPPAPIDPMDVPPTPAPVLTAPTLDPIDSAMDADNEQRVGADHALLKSAMLAAVQVSPDRGSKILELNDQLGLRNAVDEKNYKQLSEDTQLRQVDYYQLLQKHPELADWLRTPGNAQISHDEIPQLQQLSSAAKGLVVGDNDATGFLPPGYVFKKDGTIRGPLHADGTPPVIYKDLQQLQGRFAREEGQQLADRMLAERANLRLQDSWFPAIEAGARGRIAQVQAAISSATGGRWTFGGHDADELRAYADQIRAGGRIANPGLSGDLGQIAGSLLGDAPLYLLGGEVAALPDLFASLRMVRAATALPAVPKSEYLADVWKTALAYSPVAAVSGINTGAQEGLAYGSVDFLINALVPAAAGSKFGLANAIAPRGTETAAAAHGWTWVAGRLLAHSGSQGGINAATELGNALHEYVTGVDPRALQSEILVPRLATAGAMGVLLSGGFQLPHQIGLHFHRQQVAAHAAMMDADRLGYLMEAAEALKTPERSSAHFEALLKSSIPPEARTKFFQTDDFEGVAEAAKLKPEELAAQMGIGEEYKRALATGQAMTVSSHLLLKWGMEHPEPVVKKALLTAARSHAMGINANEALVFYPDTPKEIERQRLELEADVTKEAAGLKESDPIYQHMLGQLEGTDQVSDLARTNARLVAALHNVTAMRHNAHVKASGTGKLMDPFEEYEGRLKVQKGGTEGMVESFDALLNRVREGNLPTEKQAYGRSLVEFLERRGLKDEGGALTKIGAQKLADEKGHDLELAAERAHDEGYIADKDPQTLLDAIKAEFEGRPVYSEANRNQDAHGLLSGAKSLAQHLASKGINIADSNEKIKAALAGDPMVAKFDQPGERASIEWDDARHFVVTLNGNADPASIAHEIGHYWLEVMGDYAQRPDSAPQIVSDYAKILEFIGYGTHENKLAQIKELTDLRAGILGRDPTAAEKKKMAALAAPHEKMANALVQFLWDGVAPSKELRPVFQRFAIWLGALYKGVKNLVTLTPEVRPVFERLLATDEAIEQVNKDLGTSTIYKDRESSGMSEEKWAQYIKTIERDRDKLHANVFAQAMAVLRKENTKTYNRERDKIASQATAIVKQRPVNIAVDELVHGVDVDGNQIDVPKLSRKELNATPWQVKDLPRGITTDDASGMPIQVAAEHYNFQNAEEFLAALANYKKPKDQIRELTDQIMKATHPEMTPEAMHEAAMDAVHANNAHADVLSQESAALAIQALKQPIPQEQMKQIAEKTIADTNHLDVKPEAHLRAEMKFSDQSTQAFLQVPPDYTAAFLFKQRQELSHAMYRAAMEAKEVIQKAGELTKRVGKTDNLREIAKAGGFVVTGKNGERFITSDADQAAAFARDYEGTVQNYLQAMESMLDLWNNKALRFDMTYGAVRDFYGELVAIQHQGKDAFKLLVEGKRIEVQEAVDEGIDVETANSKGEPYDERPVGAIAAVGTGLRKYGSMMRNLAFVCRQMDGEKNGGWHWDHFDRPLTEAAVAKLDMDVQDAVWFKAHIADTLGKADLSKKLFVPATGTWLSHGQRLSVALNSGSTKNLRRLMDGEKWNAPQVKGVTDTLTREDWKYVTGVWAYLRTKKEPIFSLEQKLNGLAPEARDTIPIETPYGTIDGGYYPIYYDPALSARSGEISLERPHSQATALPRSGFTMKTVERTDLRLLLDSRVLTRHLSDVSQFLTHAEPVSNINKLLRNQGLTDSMITRFGVDSFKVIQETVKDAAQGMRGPQTFAENILHFVRTRSGAAIMGFNAISAASQVFGMTQSMERVGHGPYMSAMVEIMQSATTAEKTSEWVMAKSDAMRLRGKSQYIESLEAQSAGAKAFTSVPGWFREHAYWLSNKAQWLVDLPTWVAGYRNALNEFPEQEAKAIALADSAVLDTQGSGFLKDQSKIQRLNEWSKLFMQFGSFFNKTYQLGYNRIAKETTLTRMGPVRLPVPDSAAAVGRMAGSFLLLVSLPAVAMSLFREAVKPSADDDGSPEFWAKHLAKDHLGYLLNTMVLGRELSGALNGFDYSGPAGLRSFSLVNQLFKQIGQGEADHGLERAVVGTVGTFWGLPAVQIQRIIDGILYDSDRGSVNPLPLLVGPPSGK